MSAERATFAVELKDETSRPALDAARSLVELKTRLEAGTAKLREMQAAMARLKSGSNVSIESVKRLKDQIDAQKASVSSMQEKWLSLGGAFGATKKGTEGAASGLDKLLEGARSLGGPLGTAASGVSALRASAVAGPMFAFAGALAAIVTATIAVAAATAALVVQLASYAFASANARRNEMLRLEGLMTLRRYNVGAAGSARELGEAIDRVSAGSSLGRQEVTGYGEQLYRAGFRGSELSAALEAVGTTASVQGDRYAQRFISMARHTRSVGGSVRELADTVRQRIGGIAQRQALDFDVQMERLRENFGHLFDGLDIEPALRGLRAVTSLFSQQSVFGRSLALIFQTLFNPLLRGSEDAGTAMRHFLIGALVSVLRLGTAVLRIRNGFMRTFGPVTVDQVMLLRGAFLLGASAAALLAVALIPVAVAVIAIGAFMAAPIVALYTMWRLFQSFASWLDSSRASWGDAGKRLVDGFAQGIRNALPTARGAVMGLAGMATGALRSALDIHSPSRVFARLGREIPRGLAVGIESESGAADGAAGDMVAPRAPRGGSGGGVTIGEIHVHTNGGDGPSIAESIREQLVLALRGLATETGAPA